MGTPQGDTVPGTATLTMSPYPHRDLGTTTVSLDRLVADPSLPLALSHVPLLDPRGQPTGVSTHPCTQSAASQGGRQARSGVPLIPLQCTITLRCYYVPRGAARDAAVPLQGRMSPRTVSPGTPRRSDKPRAGRKQDFQVGHP